MAEKPPTNREDMLSLAARPYSQWRDTGSQLRTRSESVGVVEVVNNPACTTPGWKAT